MGSSHAFYNPQPRIYYAMFTDGLDIDWPVSRRLISNVPFRDVEDNAGTNYPYFDSPNPDFPEDFRTPPWLTNGADYSLYGAMTWDGPNKRWLYVDNFDQWSLYEVDEYFSTAPRKLATNLNSSSSRDVYLLGRIDWPPQSGGLPTPKIIWVEKWRLGISQTNYNEFVYVANMDGSNKQLIQTFFNPIPASGNNQTFSRLLAWCFDQRTGDIFYVWNREVINAIGNTQSYQWTLSVQTFDPASRSYPAGRRVLFSTNNFTGSSGENQEFLGAPFLSRAHDDAILLPYWDHERPTGFQLTRSFNRVMLINKSTGLVMGTIDLPNPTITIPDDFDPAEDLILYDGKTVIAWSSEVTQRLYVMVSATKGQFGWPGETDENSPDGVFQANLDGSDFTKMIARPFTGIDAIDGLGLGITQNVFLGPGCHGAWECCT